MTCVASFGDPHHGWFRMEHPVKMDGLGVRLFPEPPFSISLIEATMCTKHGSAKNAEFTVSHGLVCSVE